MLDQILKEYGPDLISAVTQGSELDKSQAEGLVPPALGQLGELIGGGGGGLDLGELLGGGSGAVSSLLGQLDIGKIAGAAGLDEGQTRSGLTSLIPVVLNLLGKKSGGVEGLAAMLGGKDGGGALGKLGGIAGKLLGD